MANKLKLFAPLFIAALTFLMPQIHFSQAADDTPKQAEEEKRVEVRLTIPPVAQGHEKIYERFLNGALIYRPNEGSDTGMITLPIRDLTNPLEGTFDLSGCGDTGEYLSISTGYRKGKKPENAKKRKVEIWFAPRFLIEKELNTTAKHFQPIYGNWKEAAEVGIFWTWGGAGDMGWYDYLVTENMDNLSKINLYENWKRSALSHGVGVAAWGGGCSEFHVSFVN